MMETYKSPDKQHTLTFVFEGEIRFGPCFYRVELDGEMISDKIFGEGCLWHPDSSYVALQEWLTTDYQKGPITALTLIDVENKKIARFSEANKGFVFPLDFGAGSAIYEKNYFAWGKKVRYEIKLEDIQHWEDI